MRSNARLRGAVAAALGAAALSVPAFAGCGGGARQRDPHRREPRGGRALPRGTPPIVRSSPACKWGATTCPSGRVSNTGC